jgi:uncharacterized protein
MVPSKQTRAILWINRENTSFEYFTLKQNRRSFVLTGTIVLLLEELPTKVTYTVNCDRDWKTKSVSITQERAGKMKHLILDVDSNQIWRENGNLLPLATGVFDVDFEISPCTNTLPIHRLSLNVGETQEVDAVWVRFPSLKIDRLKQRYTRLSSERYRYQALPLNYEAEIQVDDAGLVTKYGDLWERIDGQ